MRKELKDKVLPEAPVQAVVDEQVGEVTPDTPEAVRRTETWPADDTRKLVRTIELLNTRQVGMVLVCGGCNGTLKLEGRDNGGASLMGCKCVVRRWL